MQDFIAAIISFFLIQPLQAEINDKLAAASAPQAIVANVTACAQTAAPAIVEQATNDPWWAVTTAFNIWTGMENPERVLAGKGPACGSALEAARPFLSQAEA